MNSPLTKLLQNTLGAAHLESTMYRKRLRLKRQKVENLHLLISETLKLYNSISCPCAFPRFRQITGIDCNDYGTAFCISETEMFIKAIKPFYLKQTISAAGVQEEDWMCKKCGSLWQFKCSRLSALVRRKVLKIHALLAINYGAPPSHPIPLYIDPGRAGFPISSGIKAVEFDTFRKYMQEVL